MPYYEKTKDEQISVNKLKEEYMLDPRIPRGIVYLDDETEMIYIRKPNPKRKVIK